MVAITAGSVLIACIVVYLTVQMYQKKKTELETLYAGLCRDLERRELENKRAYEHKMNEVDKKRKYYEQMEGMRGELEKQSDREILIHIAEKLDSAFVGEQSIDDSFEDVMNLQKETANRLGHRIDDASEKLGKNILEKYEEEKVTFFENSFDDITSAIMNNDAR